MQDYIQMRSEVVNHVDQQQKIINVTATVVLGLLSYSLSMFKEKQDASILGLFLLLVIPSSISFLGMYWLDLVYQQKRYDAYIICLEREITYYFSCNNVKTVYSNIYYPSWQAFYEDTLRIKKGSRIIYFTLAYKARQMITLGFYITSPICICIYGCNTLNINLISSSLFITTPSLRIYVVVWIAAFVWGGFYIRKILRIGAYINKIRNQINR